jgi:hypothetical protein
MTPPPAAHHLLSRCPPFLQPEDDVEERDVHSRAFALGSLQQITLQLFSDAMDPSAAQLLLTRVSCAGVRRKQSPLRR